MLQLNKIYNMDCKEGMKLLPDNSISSIVTDPPYGLSKEPNIVEVLTNWLNNKEYIHNSKGFMGKEWDSFVPNPPTWKEAYRVLKSGGYLLCFASTRTYDLMCISLRLAGFEIRDQIDWIFGSGFPKSQDISKMIDKKYGAEREIVGRYTCPDEKPKYTEGRNSGGTNFGSNDDKKQFGGYITTPSTDDAKQFSGYGTSLKPAHEPIIVARKPLSEKTIVDNVLKWNTGGINIDDCRVESSEEDKIMMDKKASKNPTTNYSDSEDKIYGKYALDKASPANQIGRFPANIIMDEDAGKILDLQSGKCFSGSEKYGIDKKCESSFWDKKDWHQTSPKRIESNGASRFFKQCNYDNSDYEVINFMYCAKASKKERGEGNSHPTVKPKQLIKYLVTLVTPPKGICLDLFLGSGTTAIACEELGFDYIGFELNKEYCDIAEKRIKEHLNKL